MARLLGSDMPTWGTYEAGTQRIPPDQALKLSPISDVLLGRAVGFGKVALMLILFYQCGIDIGAQFRRRTGSERE